MILSAIHRLIQWLFFRSWISKSSCLLSLSLSPHPFFPCLSFSSFSSLVSSHSLFGIILLCLEIYRSRRSSFKQVNYFRFGSWSLLSNRTCLLDYLTGPRDPCCRKRNWNFNSAMTYRTRSRFRSSDCEKKREFLPDFHNIETFCFEIDHLYTISIFHSLKL